MLIVELLAEHPFLRNFGNPSTRVNLVMTSPYERASERPYVHTDSGGWGGKSHGSSSRMRSFLGGITKIHCYIVVPTTIAKLVMFSWEGLTEAESEREESVAKLPVTGKELARKIAKESCRHGEGKRNAERKEAAGTVLNNAWIRASQSWEKGDEIIPSNAMKQS